jgi:hypothetical protein
MAEESHLKPPKSGDLKASPLRLCRAHRGFLIADRRFKRKTARRRFKTPDFAC